MLFFKEKREIIVYINIWGLLERNKMRELSVQEQFQITGGVGISTALIYIIIGAGLYKIYKSKHGKISISKLLIFEWN